MRRMMLLVVGAAVVVAGVAGAVSALLASGPSGAETVTDASSAILPAASSQARWVITDLGTLGGEASYTSAVNERRQVVGESMTSAKSGYYPFFWQNGKMRAVGTLGGRKSAVVGINDNGQVIGNSDTKRGASHAFVWENGKIRDLGGSCRTSFATAINDRGQIVGGCDTGKFTHGGGLPVFQAFLWQNGKMRFPGVFIARAINERGQVIGDADEGVGVRSFLWEEDKGNVTDLGSLGDPIQGGAYTYMNAFAINERGQVIGYEEVDGGAGGFSGVLSFLWQNGKIRDLGTLNPTAINDRGQIVGTTTTRENHAASLWENGRMTDLGTLPGGKESWAAAINNRGQIVGSATTKNGKKHAVLWTFRSG